MRMLYAVTALLSCCGVANMSYAWGAAGHETSGAIADRLLAGTRAAVQVAAILGIDLRTAAVWADCAKGVAQTNGGFQYTADSRYPECRPFENAAGEARMVDFVARNWSSCHPQAGAEPCHKQYHYTDVAIERDAYSATDEGASDHDIVAASRAAILVLQGAGAPAPFAIKDKQEALLMLSHYVGDIHQPLHVGAVYLDATGREVDPDRDAFDPQTNTRGGNRLLDRATGTRVPMHTEWDGIPAKLHADRLRRSGSIRARRIAPLEGAAIDWPKAWADQALRTSHAVFNGVDFGAEDPATQTWTITLPAGYAALRQRIQREQLIIAGARLAQVLEKIFP